MPYQNFPPCWLQSWLQHCQLCCRSVFGNEDYTYDTSVKTLPWGIRCPLARTEEWSKFEWDLISLMILFPCNYIHTFPSKLLAFLTAVGIKSSVKNMISWRKMLDADLLTSKFCQVFSIQDFQVADGIAASSTSSFSIRK